MRRDPLPWVLLLLLALAGGVAWLSRNPQSPVLDRVIDWPLVGPAGEWFRGLYDRPPPPPPREPEVEVIDLRPPLAEPREVVTAVAPRQRLWVRAGTELRATPAADGAVEQVVPGLTRMELVERRGEWYRLSRRVPGGRSYDGWARLGSAPEPSRQELWAAEPVLPLPAEPPAPELLEAGEELMGGDARANACGPYRLLTDLEDPGFAARCAALASELDTIYRRRFGLEPVSGPAEAVLVFRSLGPYLLFRARAAAETRRHAFAAPARGIVALAAEGRVAAQLQATLAHELTHLLNRRALGPALPPWLEEGLAEELAISRFDGTGRLQPGTLGGWEVGPPAERRIGGGRIAVARLRSLAQRDRLPSFRQLVALDQERFQEPALQGTHYTLAAWWVRYLLSDEPTREGFRAFLGAVASGEPITEELLLGSLAAGWEELESGFRGWLASGEPA